MFGLAIEIRLGLDLLASVALDPSIEVVVLTLRALIRFSYGISVHCLSFPQVHRPHAVNVSMNSLV